MSDGTLRADKAFAWLQRRLGTDFDFVMFADATSRDYFTTEPSDRGAEDPASFIVTVGPAVAALSDRDLLSAAFHEILHALTWRHQEAGLYRLRKPEAEALHATWEASVHVIERRIKRHVIPFWKRRI